MHACQIQNLPETSDHSACSDHTAPSPPLLTLPAHPCYSPSMIHPRRHPEPAGTWPRLPAVGRCGIVHFRALSQKFASRGRLLAHPPLPTPQTGVVPTCQMQRNASIRNKFSGTGPVGGRTPAPTQPPLQCHTPSLSATNRHSAAPSALQTAPHLLYHCPTPVHLSPRRANLQRGRELEAAAWPTQLSCTPTPTVQFLGRPEG